MKNNVDPDQFLPLEEQSYLCLHCFDRPILPNSRYFTADCMNLKIFMQKCLRKKDFDTDYQD